MKYPLLTILGEMMGQRAFILQSTGLKHGYQEAFGIKFSPYIQDAILRNATAWYATLNGAQMSAILEGYTTADDVEEVLPNILGEIAQVSLNPIYYMILQLPMHAAWAITQLFRREEDWKLFLRQPEIQNANPEALLCLRSKIHSSSLKLRFEKSLAITSQDFLHAEVSAQVLLERIKRHKKKTNLLTFLDSLYSNMDFLFEVASACFSAYQKENPKSQRSSFDKKTVLGKKYNPASEQEMIMSLSGFYALVDALQIDAYRKGQAFSDNRILNFFEATANNQLSPMQQSLICLSCFTTYQTTKLFEVDWDEVIRTFDEYKIPIHLLTQYGKGLSKVARVNLHERLEESIQRLDVDVAQQKAAFTLAALNS